MAEIDSGHTGGQPFGWAAGGWTDEAVRRYFDDALDDLRAGEGIAVCGGLMYPHRLDDETLSALEKYASNPTPQALADAYQELERQLDGTHVAERLKDIQEFAKRHGYA